MSATSRPDDSNFISIKNAVSFADGLSMDMRKDNYRMYAIRKMQFKNQESFAKFYLLLSCDIELNPGPNPCMICSGSVNKRGLFCDICGIGCHKKCNTTAIEYHSNFICIQCHDRNSLDIDSTYSTLLSFSDLDNLDEMFGC